MVYMLATVVAVSSNEVFVVSEDIHVRLWWAKATVLWINYTEINVGRAG
jgi:hypothetical protein